MQQIQYGFAKISLFLAIVLEVFPTEADILFMPLESRDWLALVWLKCASLAWILSPLAIHVRRHGWKPKSIIVPVLVIVGVNLAMNGVVVVDMSRR